MNRRACLAEIISGRKYFQTDRAKYDTWSKQGFPPPISKPEQLV